jgi:hypothetical protein
MTYHAWLFLQDGNATGVSLASIGSNLLANSVEKIITYKSFLKLIPNSGQDISVKSKLKLVAEWPISGEYYQLYGWISGQSSKINMHNFELDDYPDQDFFGDLILFKVDLNGHACLEINEIDVHSIDIAKREADLDEEAEDEEGNDENIKDDNNEDEDEDSDHEKSKGKDGDDDESDDEKEDEDDDFDYEDDKPDADDALDDEDNDYYDDDEDGGGIERLRKKGPTKPTVCNFTRLVCEGILKEQTDKNAPLNDKQTKTIGIFHKLLFPKKTNLNKNESLLLRELERGIFNWTIKEADKNGFMCLWDDRQFNRIYTRKAISIYQNLCNENTRLVNFIQDPKSNGDNAYQISYMTPNELYPEKYTEIMNKIKEKEKVIFEKRATVGSKHFKCGKCKERDVSVTTAQTRSGDEGITLFLTCNNCGNQWKMS